MTNLSQVLEEKAFGQEKNKGLQVRSEGNKGLDGGSLGLACLPQSQSVITSSFHSFCNNIQRDKQLVVSTILTFHSYIFLSLSLGV